MSVLHFRGDYSLFFLSTGSHFWYTTDTMRQTGVFAHFKKLLVGVVLFALFVQMGLPLTTYAGSASQMSNVDFTTTLRIISLLSPKTHLSIMELPNNSIKGVIYDIAQGTTWSWSSLIPSLLNSTTGMMPAGAFLSYPFGQLADYLKNKTYTFKTRQYEVEQSVMSMSIDPSYTLKKDAVILNLKFHFVGDTSQDDFQNYWTPSNNAYGFYLSIGSELEAADPITGGKLLKASSAISGDKIVVKNNDGAPSNGIFINLTPVLSKNNTGQANAAKNDFTIRLPIKIEDKQGQKLYAQVQYETGNLGGQPGLIQAYSKALQIPFDTATESVNDADFNALEGGIVAQANSQETTNGQLAGDLKCTFSEWYIADCIGQLFLYVLIPIASFTVFLAGKLMDIMLSMSISSAVYRDISFILEGWRIVRDLCNLLFIFILIYVSISMILGGGGGEGGSNPKKMIAQLVLIAVVINFSLFTTRIIIDAGNILSHVFYNQISVCGNGGVATAGITSNTSDCAVENYQQTDGTNTIIPETRSLSLGLMKGINPQQILSLEMVQKMRTTQASPSISVIILGLMLCALMIGMAIIFFKMAGVFVGRIAGLWMLIIGAPLAFLSTIIPGLPLDMFSWKKWFSDLISLSLMPALFLFFIYLTFMLINPPSGSSILAGMVGNPNINAMESLVLMALAFALIYGLLSKGADISKKMAGEAGNIVGNMVQGALSFAVGAALAIGTGGAALAGRKVLGQAAMNTLTQHGDTLKDAASGKASAINELKSSKKFGAQFRGLNDAQSKEKAMEIATSLQNKAERSYDFRNTGAGNMFAKASGINLNPTGQIGALFGGDNTKTGKFFNAFDANTTLGGAQAERDRKVEKEKAIIEKLGYNKTEEHELIAEKEKIEAKSLERDQIITANKAALDGNQPLKQEIKTKEDDLKAIEDDIKKAERKVQDAAQLATTATTDAQKQQAQATLQQAQQDRDRVITNKKAKEDEIKALKNDSTRFTTTTGAPASLKQLEEENTQLENNEKTTKAQLRVIDKKIQDKKKERARTYIKWTEETNKGNRRNRTDDDQIEEGWDESGFSFNQVTGSSTVANWRQAFRDGEWGKSIMSFIGEDLAEAGRNAGIGAALGTWLFPGIGTVAGGMAGFVGTATVGALKGFEKFGGGFLRSLQWQLDHSLLARNSDHRDPHHGPERVAVGASHLDRDLLSEQIPRSIASRVRNVIGTTQALNLSVDIQDSHYHGGHFSKKYKGPNSSFLDIFAGLGKSGGGGHDDHGHGGGHDDHGGGGHH